MSLIEQAAKRLEQLRQAGVELPDDMTAEPPARPSAGNSAATTNAIPKRSRAMDTFGRSDDAEPSGSSPAAARRVDLDLNAVANPKLFRQSPPFGAVEPRGVGFVHHEPGAVALFEPDDFAERGDVAVHRVAPDGTPDPVFFLEYFKNPDGTRKKYTGDWCRTGDVAAMDERGDLWYQGRADDMFKAAGYRIGPSEIENCLVKHAAVANAAVVPSPDEERGNVVKAYVVLAPGHAPSAALEEDIRQHVRGKLAPYEYPREIEFIDALPMTTTGKVQRRVLRLQEEERARAAAGAA